MSLNKSYNYSIGTMGNINVTGITTGTINVSGLSTLINTTVTNVSTGTINASTGITASSAQITNIVGTTISAGTLIGTTITGGNLSLSGNLIVAGTLTSVNITTTNLVDTNISAGLLNATTATIPNIVGTNISAGTVRATSNLIAVGNSNTLGNIYTTGGNIGVGTVTPGVTLDVKGQQYISPSSFTTTAAGGQSLLVTYPKLTINTNTNAWPATSGIIGSNVGLRLRGNDDASLDFGVNSINAWIQSTNWNSYNNNYNIVLNPNGGNVGIATGTSSPGYTLDINGSCKVTTQLYVGNSGGAGTIFMGGGSAGDSDYNFSVIETRNYSGSEGTEMLLFKGNDASGPSGPDRIRLRAGGIAFDTYNSDTLDRTAENIRMYINGSGNVGIGTVSPGYALHVNGNVKSSSTLLVGTSTDTDSSRLISALNSSMSTNSTNFITFGQGNSSNNQAELGFNYVGNGSTSNALTLGLHGGEKMRIRADGNIGIGTNSPSYTLDVNGNGRVSSALTIGTGNTSAWAHQTISSNANYPMAFCADRGVLGSFLFGNANQSVAYVIINNANYGLEVGGAGRFGGSLNIGTVITLQASSPSSRGQVYFPSEGEVRSSGAIWLFGANTTLYGPGPYSSGSDTRIKENIIDIDDTSALAIIRQIQPKRYNYVDRQNKGDSPVWGFIAQQVASVLDYAVDTIIQFIPNVYESASVGSDNHAITLNNKTTTDLVVGMKIRLDKADKTSVETSIISIVDNKTFTVECDLTDVKNDDSKVFVYGIQVDDFHSLNKDAIFTIATAALQEVDRELQTTKTELQTEKQKITRLEQFIQSKFPGEF